MLNSLNLKIINDKYVNMLYNLLLLDSDYII